MKLEKLTDNNCPVPSCQSETICIIRSIERNGLGQHDEMRQYACGLILHYDSKEQKTIIMYDCPNRTLHEKTMELRKNAKKELETFCNGLEVDDDFKSTMISAIRKPFIDF